MNIRKAPYGLLGVMLALTTLSAMMSTVPLDQGSTQDSPRVFADASGRPTSRAVWVWSEPRATKLVTWSRANHVQTIFLQVPGALPSSSKLPWAASVSRAAHAHGIQVAALNGDLGWLQRPGSAVKWATAAESTGLFDSIHVDVEPWAMPAWKTQAPQLASQYVELLTRLSSAIGLPVEADVAYWLDRVSTPDGIPLDVAAMRAVDAVTVMSYRNQPSGQDGITGVGARAIHTAEATHTPYRLAVETMYYGSDPTSTKQTFYHLGRSRLRQVLSRVDRLQQGSNMYRGVAIHHYDAWRSLKR